MATLDRSETLQRIATNQLRTATLINDLNRSVRILTADIEHQEAQTGVRDLKSPAYPVMARHLRAQRDNLRATIASLEATAGSASSAKVDFFFVA
jgi:hypothetical protein